MTDNVESLVLDMLEWIGAGGRPYAQVLDAWRTSCPRLQVWEEANDRGLVSQAVEPSGDAVVLVTAAGRETLRKAGRPT